MIVNYDDRTMRFSCEHGGLLDTNHHGGHHDDTQLLWMQFHADECDQGR
jgi:hypothetical protein